MNRKIHILLFFLAVLMTAFAGTGCVEPLRPEDIPDRQQGVQLPIRIVLPAGVKLATKAGLDGPVSGIPAESALRSLQVWAFSHPVKPEQEMSEEEKAAFLNEGSITYLSVPDVTVLDSPDENATVQVSMFIPDYFFSRPEESMKLDFYVLGNGTSIGWISTEAMKRREVRDTVFSGWRFGTHSDELTDEVPAEGIPLACFYDNRGNGFDVSFLKTDPNPTAQRMEEIGRVWPEMDLTRSVSRIRFLFSQATGMSGTSIDSVKLYDFDNVDDPGLIPTESFVFPREDARDIALPEGVNYESLTWGYSTGLVSLIGQMDDPFVLCSNSETMRGMSAEFFENYLQELLKQDRNKPTVKVLYLRESDRPIKGRIYYNGKRVSGEIVEPSKSTDFTMNGLGFPDRTNFYRNHSWTVYAYMIGSHMEVDVRLDDWVVPWTRSEATLDGSAAINVDQDGKFITDADMVADTLRDNAGYIYVKPNGKPKKKWFNVPVPAGDDGVTGRVVVYAPEGGELIVTPVAVDTAEFWPRLSPEEKAVYEADPASDTYVTKWFDISMTAHEIHRNYVDPNSKIPGLIGITVKPKVPAPGAQSGRKAIKLSFAVKVGDRMILADSEMVDEEYHFVIDP